MKKLPDMPCEYCEGTIRERRVRDDYWSGDQLVIIEDVPVGVCDRCGERYYPAAVLEKMDQIARRRSRIKRTIRVPVTTFETSA
jgi:YgiT-type zinc finger domain-containing protein